MKPPVLLHVIKTGGTTVGRAIDVIEGSRRGHDLIWSKRMSENFNTIMILRDPADWMVSVYHQAVRRMGVNMSFEEFYERKESNPVNPQKGRYNRMSRYASRFFGCDETEVVHKIRDLWGVFVTEWIDDSLELLMKYYGLDPLWKDYRVTGEYDEVDEQVTPKVYTISEKMRKRIYTENPVDCSLYAEALILNNEWKNRITGEKGGKD